jgi:SsrA-binding protein
VLFACVVSSLADMSGHKIVATNRKARYNYEILDTFEAGIVLLGSEVKSLRDAQIQLKDSYASIRGGEVWLENAHIAPYAFAQEGGHDPERPRKLLLHRREIDRLFGRIREEGLTLVPLQVYFKEGKAKVELGLGKGKRTRDKRRDIVKRQQKREMDRAQSHRR